MIRARRRLAAAIAVGAAAAMILTGCSGGGGSSGGGSGKSLVVDNSFDLKTSDPGRAFELTGSIVDKAIYETVLTFNGSDVTKPQPDIMSYVESNDDKTLTLTMHGKHYFSNGDPVTVDDVVFSLKRVQAIAGNPSFLLDGVTVTKKSDTQVVLTSATPNPALPFILPNPSLGILNSKVLKQHGGTDTKSDNAEAFLNKESQGSGPYMLSSYNVNTKVVFKPNPHYVGTKPAYSTVVLENVAGPTQKINVQAGASQVALDLNATQVQGLDGGKTKVIKGTSPYVMYLWFNQNSAIGAGVTNNQDFLTAIRKSIDYSKILQLSGSGSTQPGGLVPSMFKGSIKPDSTNSYDLSAAKAALAKSGYNGQTVKFSYPNDITVDGLQFETLAQALQSQWQEAGIKVTLAPGPVATVLDSYRNGTLQSGIMYWGPDFPDPSDYLVFSPGQSLGLRAGWKAGADATVTDAANAAASASGAARVPAFESWQKAMNATGPFVPLVQPGQYVVTANTITSVPLNPVWTVDLAAIK
ncbi:ABC transporter substrate-binding protein [Humibacter ginsenosidimutans]|uniref:ABC transporter substrate-binding protein n=1 Tax=Humibacter ginsenosidimutans TaxID=2599293 RepID=A0A5B8M6Q0_9MICO|nr:ABC transporter substrate-binding protein [Humibacter ginsenosidimutans]QDZ15664.1 ABC transporter substrate-binding protein [Humibacter ginsenosidimutans]